MSVPTGTLTFDIFDPMVNKKAKGVWLSADLLMRNNLKCVSHFNFNILFVNFKLNKLPQKQFNSPSAVNRLSFNLGTK
jgi:hypothetical protein